MASELVFVPAVRALVRATITFKFGNFLTGQCSSIISKFSKFPAGIGKNVFGSTKIVLVDKIKKDAPKMLCPTKWQLIWI